MAETVTSALLGSEFQRLCDRRDLAAYNCVNAIQFVLSMFEAQNFDQSREYLRLALEQHKQADQEVTAFLRKLISKKENHDHGNRSAA